MRSINDLLNQAQQAEQQGNLSFALQCYQQLLLQHPKELSLHVTCGNLCIALTRFEEAAGYFRRVLYQTKSDDARNALCFALQALGNHAQAQGNYALAVASYEEVITFEPKNAVYWYNLGNAQRELGESQKALASFKQAIKLDPNDADFYNNLGNIQRELGALDLAITSYEKALQLNPNLHHALVHLVHQKQHACDWHGLDVQIMAVRNLVKNVLEAQVSPFAFLSLPNTTAAEQRICANNYVAQTYAKLFEMRHSLNLTYSTNKKIRIGYLSADFRLHPLAFLITEMIENHDRSQYEVHAYSYGQEDKTATRKRLVQAFDQFHNIRQLSDQAAAKKINADGITILIDLTGFTQSCRSGIVALKPAPISINWLGYPGTMGALDGKPLFDYLLADKVIAPNADDFSEKLLYLPCYQPNNQRVVGKTTNKTQHHLAEDAFVFCSFNQSFKITPEIFAIWMRLLAQVPNSVLWLLDCNPLASANLMREAKAAGIDASRLMFAPRVSIEAHMERQRHADLFLDTLPYNAHTTASDALYMGLPVLTCMGETMPARVAASLLTSIGLPELISENLQKYEEKALFLAQHPSELARIRQQLTRQKTTSNLFKPKQFVHGLELLLEAILLKLVIK